MKYTFTLMLLSISIFISCKKDNPGPSKPADVYVLGLTTQGNGNTSIDYWKNGVITHVATAPTYSGANKMVVSGSDVYIAGAVYSGTGGNYTATIWKNGTSIPLSDGNSYAYVYDVFISGTDVYACGTVGGIATVWKNGVATNLTDGSFIAAASNIFVSGSDVYVAGYGPASGGQANVLLYWKNGPMTALTDGSQNAYPGDLLVENGNVYIAGADGKTIKLWKNGTSANLTDGTNTDAYLNYNCLAVQNGNVHIVAAVKQNTLWDLVYYYNGKATTISDQKNDCEPNGLAVKNNIVYISGDYTSGTTVLWENGKSASLAPYNLNNTSIEVVDLKAY